SFLSPHSKH
ncbi:hypothetical protein D030_1980B, partial [Vibrio parahaemolyticus AQ3810]